MDTHKKWKKTRKAVSSFRINTPPREGAQGGIIPNNKGDQEMDRQE